MAGNTQLNENERGIFALHGVSGMLIAVVLLLSILAFLVINAVGVQQREAQNFYSVNQDLNGLKMISKDNVNQYKLKKGE
jgi:ABC-type phosphate transport system permease subunit